MASASSNNVLQLQNALKNLEERYKKLQDKASTLQLENERLITSRTELVSEIERLQDQQIKLRERNLRLTHEYSTKQQECSLLAEKLMLFARGRVTYNKASGTYTTSDSPKQIETSDKNKVNVLTSEGQIDSDPHIKSLTSNRTLSEPNLTVLQNELDVVRKGLWSPVVGSIQSSTPDELSSSIIAGLKKNEVEMGEQLGKMLQSYNFGSSNVQASKPAVGSDDSSVEKIHCSLCCSKEVREKLTVQNQKLKRLFSIVQAATAGNDPHVAAGTQTSLEKQSISLSLGSPPGKICPLCEENFAITEPQENFVDHVMSHFNDENALAALQILT